MRLIPLNATLQFYFVIIVNFINLCRLSIHTCENLNPLTLFMVTLICVISNCQNIHFSIFSYTFYLSLLSCTSLDKRRYLNHCFRDTHYPEIWEKMKILKNERTGETIPPNEIWAAKSDKFVKHSLYRLLSLCAKCSMDKIRTRK